MEIRDTETVKRYNEAKKFVEQYEMQYCLALLSGSCFDNDIWNWRYDIQYRLDQLKKLGMLNEPKHPYNLQIENRRRYIKDKLKEKYNYR
jgi:hypothetical protein